MEATTPLPFLVHSDAYSPDDVIDAAVLEAFSSRAFPVARTIKLARVRPSASLLPPTASAFLEATDEGETRRLAGGNGWMLRSVRYANGSARLTVVATSVTLAKSVLAAAARDAVDSLPADTASFGFWHRGQNRAKHSERALPIERWTDIRGNYAAANTAALDELMDADPALLEGRLALLYGPPGTGKTTLIRSLADAWREWCTPEYVLDADRLLGDPDYLSLLGQGLNLLVLISTNDELARLHPAITRPGRCFAQIRVGPLPYGEASHWLGRRDGIGPDGATLAELFALRREPGTSLESIAGHPGQYL